MSTTIATRPRIAVRRPVRSRKSIVGDWAAFLVPVSGAFVVSFGGMLPYTEIIFLLVFPYLILTQGDTDIR